MFRLKQQAEGKYASLQYRQTLQNSRTSVQVEVECDLEVGSYHCESAQESS